MAIRIKFVLVAIIGMTLVAALFFAFGPKMIEKRQNTVPAVAAASVSQRAAVLHEAG